MTNIFRSLILVVLAVSSINGFVFANDQFERNLNMERFPEDHNLKSSSHFDIKIGYLSDGAITFIANPDKLKMQWEEAIKNASDLKLSFDEIDFSSEGDEYFLRAYDRQNKASAIIKLALDGDFLYEYKHYFQDSKESGSGYTVICSGCKSSGQGSAAECKVDFNPGVGFYCSDCIEGDCIKTSTLIEGGGIFD